MDQNSQKRPIIRQITIDLRPLLRHIIDASETDTPETPEVKSQKAQVKKRSDEPPDTQYPLPRNSETIRISLPSVSSYKSIEESRPPQTVQRRASLVTVTDEGTLTSDAMQKPMRSSVFFPKVILNPLQKTSGEQRPLNTVSTDNLPVMQKSRLLMNVRNSLISKY